MTLPTTGGDDLVSAERIDVADDELRRLRACVRDLVALSTVSAMWEGRDMETLAHSMAELMLSIGRLEYAYLRIERENAPPLETSRLRSHLGTTVPPELLDATRDALNSQPYLEAFDLDLPGESGRWRAIMVPIGIGARLGVAVVGCTSPEFPTDNDTLLLRVAGTQCAISLRHSRLLADARRAEDQARRASEAADRARRDAEQANRAKADFLASMSHELRTPLNAIGGYATLIEMGLRGPVTPEQAVDLQRIRRSQEYLLGLINDVLNFAKLEAGHVNLDLADVDVAQVVQTLEELVEPQVAAKHLTYACMTRQAPLLARADRDKLVQILLNLVSNAVKYTPPGGRVQIACDCDDDSVQVVVTDTGIGIPADKLSTIFDPFVQVPRDLKSSREGVGLGLAISRDLARAMGGELVAASTLGQGSAFSLALPRAASQTP